MQNLELVLSFLLVVVKLGQTALIHNCTFNDDFCQWMNEVYDEFDWIREASCTPSNNTGPCWDHGNQGSFIYIETSYPRKEGDRAILSSHASGVNCLRFWFHMWGADIGELNIYYNTSQKNFSELAWHLEGNQGNLWKFAQVSFFGHMPETVIIEGVRGSGYHGDIAIDDVELSLEISCPTTVQGVPLSKVAHWKLDGSEPEVKNVTYTSDGGQNVAFFNESTQATVPAIDLTTFTVALWIKPVLGMKHFIIGALQQFYLHLREDGKFLARYYLNNDEVVGPFGDMALQNNSWTHVAVTWDEVSKTMSMFVDATLIYKMQAESDLTLKKQIRNDYYLGWKDNRPNMWYRGLMRDLQVFSKVLSPAELQFIKGPPCGQLCMSPGICDQWTGNCSCGNLKHVDAFCRNALDKTIYHDAVAYYPMDTSQDILNLKTDQEIGSNHKIATLGPVNQAVLLDHVEVSLDPSEMRCLTEPRTCTNGLSLAFWINILEISGSEALILSPGGNEQLPGVILKVLTRGAQKMFQISVVQQQISSVRSRCEVEFKLNVSSWTHVVFTWYNGHEMTLFLNGNTGSPVLGSCYYEAPPSIPPSRPIIVLGSLNAAMLLDDVALWDRPLHFEEIDHVYYTVVTNIKKNISVQVKFVNETWHDELQDPESETYNNFRSKMLLNLNQLFKDKVSYHLEMNQLSAGSVNVNFTIMFRTLEYPYILALNDAFYINKSLGNMAIGNTTWQFGGQVPQEAPNITHVTILNKTSVVITWDDVPFECFAGAPQGYKIVYYDNANAHAYKDVLVPGFSTDVAVIGGLQPNIFYSMHVLAVNVFADGPLSDPVIVQTSVTAPSLPPLNVTAVSTGPHDIFVSWRPAHQVAPVLGYEISWQRLYDHFTSHFQSKSLKPQVNITGLQVSTWYQVTVRAYNSIGSGPNSSYVNVQTKNKVPCQSPQNVTAHNLTATSFELTWSPVPPEYANGVIQGYRVRVWKQAIGVIPTPLTLNLAMVNITSALIGGLQSNTQYEVEVSAYTSVGEGIRSIILVMTQQGLLPPQNVTVIATSSTSLFVKWPPVSSISHNAYSYRVTWAVNHVRISVTVARTSYNIKSLKPFTTYEVRVAAVDGSQIGPFSSAVWAKTLEGVPSQPPLNVTVQNLSNSSLLLTWNPVPQQFANGRIQGYQVRVWELKNWIASGIPNVTTVDNTTTSALIGGLKPGVRYTVQISAFTSIGEGPVNQINVTTDEGVPSRPPQHVQGNNQSSTSLLITWGAIPAGFAHGIIIGYNVYVNNDSRCIVGAGARQITLTGLNKYSPYEVQISANTSKGEGPRSQQITVWTDEEVPSAPPANIFAFVTANSSIQVTWSRVPSHSENGITKGYAVKVYNSNRHVVAQFSTGKNTFDLEINHLESYGNYCIGIAALNRKGQGPLSNDVCVVTDDGAPCDPPKTLTVNDVTATTVSIQWTYHSNYSVPGFIRGYRIIYDLQGVVPSSSRFLQVAGENTNSAVLTGLKPYSTYRIRLQVMTASGRDGQPSTVWVKTKEGVPSKAPSGLEAYVVLEKEIYLRWSSVPQDSQYGIIRGFRIFYRATGCTTQVIDIKEESKRLYALTGLKPFTQYHVHILAFTLTGDGVKSPSITIRTSEGVPTAPPGNVKVQEKTSTTSLSIQWMKVPDNETNGHLIGYVVSYRVVKVGGEKVIDEVVRKRTVGSGNYSLVLNDLQSFTSYEIRVVGFTRQGEGVYSQPVIGETCHCEKRLTTNYWFYPPYVIISSTNNMSGIFMAFLDKMVDQCCGDCHNGHGKSIMDYSLDGSNNPAQKSTEEDMRKAIDFSTDLSLPVYGFSDQRKYMNNFRFVPVVESPGAAFIVTKAGLKSKSFIERSVFGCGPLLMFNVAAICLTGLLMWILESVGHDSIFPRSFLSGFPEGIWWSFVTMSTVGYGDRIPLTYGGRFLTFVWMLSGTVIFTLLISYLSSGLAVASLENNIKLYGTKVAALYNTPEYRLGIRRNAQLNPDRNYTQLEEIREDLLSGVVKGALVDSYVAAERKDLFDDPALYIHQLIYYRSSFGIVLSGKSTRLQHCFLDYLVEERSLLTELVKNYTKTLPSATSSLAEEKTADLFGNSKMKIETVVLFLAIITAAAAVSGIVYDLIMRRRRKRWVHPNDESTKKIQYRNELQGEMTKLVEEFHKTIKKRYTELSAKHREERRLVKKKKRKGDMKRPWARDGSEIMLQDLTKSMAET